MVDTIEITIAISGIIITALSISLPIHLVKSKEIENQIREKKLERYDELLTKFTQYLKDPSNKKSTTEFIESYYRASAYASNDVLQSCHNLLLAVEDQSVKRITNSSYFIPDDQSQKLTNSIFIAIRKDVKPDAPDFSFRSFKS
jgi:hypothetical protein